MRFYTGQHKHYCGIDLHARQMYLCIMDAQGKIVLLRNIKRRPKRSCWRSRASARIWSWRSNACSPGTGSPICVPRGHRLRAGARAVHEGHPRGQSQERQDRRAQDRRAAARRDAPAYVYPKAMRATRDLLRRRSHLVRKRADDRPHPEHGSQYNLPPFGKGSTARRERAGFPATSPIPRAQFRGAGSGMIEQYDELLPKLELHLALIAKTHDPGLHLLRSIPGVGLILPLVMLYEIHDIGRFARCRNFCLTLAGEAPAGSRPARCGHAARRSAMPT